MDRDALADFLVHRREELQPADVGLSTGSRRRAPGLRREEVAMLAAMSTDYYARLEQRRGPQPSVQMLSSLARALRLTSDERDYLYRVSGHSAPDRAVFSDYVAPGMLRILDRLTDTPAFVVSVLDEVLVQNDAARALFGDASALVGMERSGAYRWFAHPDTARRVYPVRDHERSRRDRGRLSGAAHRGRGAGTDRAHRPAGERGGEQTRSSACAGDSARRRRLTVLTPCREAECQSFSNTSVAWMRSPPPKPALPPDDVVIVCRR